MGCSGSRVLDETGRPSISHRTNVLRENDKKYYLDSMGKLKQLILEKPDIPMLNPIDSEEIDLFYNDNKANFEGLNFSKEEFIYSLKCYKIIEDEAFYQKYDDFDVCNLIGHIIRSAYSGDDRDKKIQDLLEALKGKGLESLNGITFNPEGIPDDLMKNLLDIFKYEITMEREALAIHLNNDIINNSEAIKSIKEIIEYNTTLSHLAIVCTVRKKDTEVLNLDFLTTILKALEINIRLKSFAVIVETDLKSFVINELDQKLLANVIKKNECLNMCVLPSIPLSESNFKLLMGNIGNHKALRGVIIDNQNFDNENKFKCFVDAVKKNKNIKVAGYWGIKDEETVNGRKGLLKDFEEKIIFLNEKYPK
jgi:hypothetical protein